MPQRKNNGLERRSFSLGNFFPLIREEMYYITSTSFSANAMSVSLLPIPKLLPLLHPPSSPWHPFTLGVSSRQGPYPVPSVTLHNTMSWNSFSSSHHPATHPHVAVGRPRERSHLIAFYSKKNPGKALNSIQPLNVQKQKQPHLSSPEKWGEAHSTLELMTSVPVFPP